MDTTHTTQEEPCYGYNSKGECIRELRPKRMLAIFAHPDDESFGAGGTLAKYAHQGVQMVLLCLTHGGAGIPGAEAKEAGDIRMHELEQAANQLGIEVYTLDYPDGGLSNIETRSLLEIVSWWIELVQPQLILTFGPDGVSGHPDHVTISKIVTQAFDLTYKKGMLLYIHPSEATELGCGISSTDTEDFQPLVEVDISAYKHEKIQAIKCHISQNPGLSGKVEDMMDDIPCSELYTIARNMSAEDNYPDWFELDKKEILVHEQT